MIIEGDMFDVNLTFRLWAEVWLLAGFFWINFGVMKVRVNIYDFSLGSVTIFAIH